MHKNLLLRQCMWCQLHAYCCITCTDIQ